MGVVEAKIQTVEDMDRLIWTAIANRQPISAIYKDRYRLFCPHRLGRNRLGQPRVLCYQYGGDSESGLAPPGSPEKLAVCDFRETEACGLGKRFLADRTKPFPSGHLRRRSRCRRRRSRRTRSTERTLRELPDQKLGKHYPQGGNRVRIMPLGANAATRAGGSPVPVRGQRIQDDRRGQRGKNGSARPPGTHKLQCRG
jgi:hypothetical protein